MKKEYASRIMIAGVIALLGWCLLYLAGCKEEKGTSAYDLVTPGKPQPIIDSLSPSGSALAAAQPITIYGKNFSSSLAENYVYFNGKPATVLSATTTKLVVNSPVDSGLEVVKMTVAGAALYSPNTSYRLYLAVESFSTLAPPATGAAALTPDSAGNIYFDLLATSVDNGIKKITPDGVQSDFAPKTNGITYWSSLKKAKGGPLYAVRGARAIYDFPSPGSAAEVWGVGSSSFADIDFDANKNIWAGGNNIAIYCFKPDVSSKLVPFTGVVHALRVYSGYLYFSALNDSSEWIFRALIKSDTLDTIEQYFNITSAVGTAYAGQAITFSTDGYMYVGTQAPLGIIIVAPDKSFSTPYSGYASMFGSQIASFAWGSGEILYGATFEGGLFKVHTRKNGAPYHGLN